MPKNRGFDDSRLRGFVLTERHCAMLDWLKYKRHGKNYSELVCTAIEGLYTKHLGPRIVGDERAASSARVSV
jgi:hypothetical protein